MVEWALTIIIMHINFLQIANHHSSTRLEHSQLQTNAYPVELSAVIIDDGHCEVESGHRSYGELEGRIGQGDPHELIIYSRDGITMKYGYNREERNGGGSRMKHIGMVQMNTNISQALLLASSDLGTYSYSANK